MCFVYVAVNVWQSARQANRRDATSEWQRFIEDCHSGAQSEDQRNEDDLKRWILTQTSDALHCTAIVVAAAVASVVAACFAVIFYLLLISFVPINFQLMHSVHLCCMLCASMLWYVSLSANLWLQWLLRITPQNLFPHSLFAFLFYSFHLFTGRCRERV